MVRIQVFTLQLLADSLILEQPSVSNENPEVILDLERDGLCTAILEQRHE